MADWKKLPDVAPGSWKDLPDVDPDAGQPGHPGVDLYARGAHALQPTEPVTPSSPRPDLVEEKRKMAMAIAGLTGGQNLASLSPEKQEEMQLKSAAGALGEGIATARGVPLVGSHIDELAALLGPKDYRSNVKNTRQAVNEAVSSNPALPIVGSLALSGGMPQSALGRIAFNTAAGASEGVGSAETLDQAPGKAAKDAAVAAVLSILTEGTAKAGMGAKDAMKTAAERQALKAAGLRGGISSQLAKRGMDDADALQLGRDALDNGLIPFGGSKAAVRDRAAALRDMAGNSYGAQLAKGDTMGALDYDELGNAMLGPYNSADAVKQGAGDQALKLVDQFAEQGQMTPGSFVGAGRAKASAWDSASFSDAAKNAPRLYRETMGAGAQNITDQLRRVDPAAADALQAAGKRYGVASDIYALAKEGAQRDLENNNLGMTELLAGIGGTAAGVPSGHALTSGALGLSTAGLAHLAKRRGNAAAAVLLDKLAAPVGVPLDFLGRTARAAEPALVEEANRSPSLLQQYLDLLNKKDEQK